MTTATTTPPKPYTEATKRIDIENAHNKLNCQSFLHMFKEDHEVQEKDRYEIYYHDGHNHHYVGEYMVVNLWGKQLEDVEQWESYMALGLNADQLKHMAYQRDTNPVIKIGCLVRIDCL